MIKFTKHIWRDNHILKKISKLFRIGGINYDLRFEANEIEWAVDYLRPEKLTLNTFNEKEPYDVITSGRIDINYSNNISIDTNNIKYIVSAPVSVYNQYSPLSSSTSINLLYDTESDMIAAENILNQYLNTNILVNIDDNYYYAYIDRLIENNYTNYIKFDKKYYKDNIDTDLQVFDYIYLDENNGIVEGIWYDSNISFTYIKDNSTNTPINYTIFANKYTLLVGCTLFDLDNNYLMNPTFSKTVFDTQLIESEESLKVFHLTDKLLTGYFGLSIEIESLNEAETNDKNTILETINLTSIFNIVPITDLNTGISFNLPYKNMEIKVFIPYNNLSGQGYAVEYVNSLNNIQESQDFSFDIENIEVIVEKRYSDRLEILSHKVKDIQFQNIKEKA